MQLWAISDLHVGYAHNKEALLAIEDHGDDWLIVAGDVGESLEHLQHCFSVLGERFAKLFWVPGNHELWTHPSARPVLRGVEKYQACVRVLRDMGVVTPEDPFVLFEGQGGPAWVVPLFLLYDYSFGPVGMDPAQAIAWAGEAGLRCADERLLHPDPHESRWAWCHHRVQQAETRLDGFALQNPGVPWVMVNHFPFRGDLVRLFRIPRFRIWCGTTLTEDWHTRYPAQAVVSGHLHMRATDWRDGVRFEEVSLGYPKHWRGNINGVLRRILPGR